jgi:SCY1-like protein 1
LQVVKDYQRLLASNPARRLNPAKILETNEYFQNKMVDTITFLESLAAKDSTDKDTFFRKLTPELSRMCKPIAVHKVRARLSSVFRSVEARARCMGCTIDTLHRSC